MTLLTLIPYLIMASLWATFCVRMQKKLVYPSRAYNKFWMVWLTSFIFAPISMLIAIIKVPIEPRGEPRE